LLLFFTISTARSVEIVTSTNSYFNTNDNVSTAVRGWTNSNGWGIGNTNTGWNYVGQMNGASGVYLGDGWVLTAGHVGVGNFTLDGNVYDTTGVSYSNFTNSTNHADLTLFQISTVATDGNTLSFSSLTLSSNAPTPFSLFQSGSQVAMLGYGGGNESWGANIVTTVNIPIEIQGYSYESIDFETAHGTTNNISSSITNNAELIVGDSGGGDFITNSSGGWTLAGINEAIDANGNSYFIQLSDYNAQIKLDMSIVPESGTWRLLVLGMAAIFGSSLWRSRKRAC
jgi:hypothetical protein